MDTPHLVFWWDRGRNTSASPRTYPLPTLWSFICRVLMALVSSALRPSWSRTSELFKSTSQDLDHYIIISLLCPTVYSLHPSGAPTITKPRLLSFKFITIKLKLNKYKYIHIYSGGGNTQNSFCYFTSVCYVIVHIYINVILNILVVLNNICICMYF